MSIFLSFICLFQIIYVNSLPEYLKVCQPGIGSTVMGRPVLLDSDRNKCFLRFTLLNDTSLPVTNLTSGETYLIAVGVHLSPQVHFIVSADRGKILTTGYAASSFCLTSSLWEGRVDSLTYVPFQWTLNLTDPSPTEIDPVKFTVTCGIGYGAETYQNSFVYPGSKLPPQDPEEPAPRSSEQNTILLIVVPTAIILLFVCFFVIFRRKPQTAHKMSLKEDNNEVDLANVKHSSGPFIAKKQNEDFQKLDEQVDDDEDPQVNWKETEDEKKNKIYEQDRRNSDRVQLTSADGGSIGVDLNRDPGISSGFLSHSLDRQNSQ